MAVCCEEGNEVSGYIKCGSSVTYRGTVCFSVRHHCLEFINDSFHTISELV